MKATFPPQPDDYAPQSGGLAARAAASAGRPRYLDALNPEQRAAKARDAGRPGAPGCSPAPVTARTAR
ncbi:MAG: hypothetical protein U1E25_16505 [Methylocystis sp.]